MRHWKRGDKHGGELKLFSDGTKQTKSWFKGEKQNDQYIDQKYILVESSKDKEKTTESKKKPVLTNEVLKEKPSSILKRENIKRSELGKKMYIKK